MPVTIPGSAIGRMQQEGDGLATEEAGPVHGGGGERAEDQGEARGRGGHAQGEAESGPHVRRAPRPRGTSRSVRPGGGKRNEASSVVKQ